MSYWLSLERSTSPPLTPRDLEIVTPPTNITVDTAATQPSQAAFSLAAATVTQATTAAQKQGLVEDDTSFLDSAPFPAAANVIAAGISQEYSFAFSNTHPFSQTISCLGLRTTSKYGPISLTSIKCVRRGVKITKETPTNDGQWRGSFHVVIADSSNSSLPQLTSYSIYSKGWADDYATNYR
ncbi:hypothetical protein BGZ60DRAFT_523127 [Tricladium varicosporioides]|nr:hypothetical protein BGZ60DRAFT_523127 [Hymenoscyphus varicosporioides]